MRTAVWGTWPSADFGTFSKLVGVLVVSSKRVPKQFLTQTTSVDKPEPNSDRVDVFGSFSFCAWRPLGNADESASAAGFSGSGGGGSSGGVKVLVALEVDDDGGSCHRNFDSQSDEEALIVMMDVVIVVTLKIAQRLAKHFC